MHQKHHVRGLEGGARGADAYSHPVGLVMKENRFISPADLRQRTPEEFSDRVHGSCNLSNPSSAARKGQANHDAIAQ